MDEKENPSYVTFNVQAWSSEHIKEFLEKHADGIRKAFRKPLEEIKGVEKGWDVDKGEEKKETLGERADRACLALIKKYTEEAK